MALKKKEKSKVHKDLKGLNISINEFGEVQKTKSDDELNQFLNENVDDKKLKERDEKQSNKKD